MAVGSAGDEGSGPAQGDSLCGFDESVVDRSLVLLGTVDESTTYEDLLQSSNELDVAGVRVRVVTLERLITIKEKLSRPKDAAVLHVRFAAAADNDSRETRAPRTPRSSTCAGRRSRRKAAQVKPSARRGAAPPARW